MALPDPALVVLVGVSVSGKSAWAAEHYRPDEVVSSDRLRALVGSGEHDLDAYAGAGACAGGPALPSATTPALPTSTSAATGCWLTAA